MDNLAVMTISAEILLVIIDIFLYEHRTHIIIHIYIITYIY